MHVYNIEWCLNPPSPPEPKRVLGWAVQVVEMKPYWIHIFVKEMCRVFFFRATYSLSLNTSIYIEKLGHTLLDFTKVLLEKSRLSKRR